MTLGGSANLLEASGTLWDALGAFWRPPGRSGTLWEPSGGIRAALGCVWDVNGRFGVPQDARVWALGSYLYTPKARVGCVAVKQAVVVTARA